MDAIDKKTLQLGALFVNSVGQADANKEAFLAASFSKNPDAVSKYTQAYYLHTQEQKNTIKQFAQEMKMN